MLVKGDKADAFVKAPAPDIWAVLIHGQDEGVANDHARDLIAAWTGGAPAEILSAADDDIRRDAAAFFDALEARSLLGEARMLRVHTSGDKIAGLLLEALQAGDKTPGRFDAKLIVTAPALAKKSKLRKAFESAERAAALQVFADQTGDVVSLIRSTLAEASVEIEDAALERMAASLPGHRRLARMEIEKLSLYAADLGRAVNAGDIDALMATDIDHAAQDFVTFTLSGKTGAALAELDRLMLAGQSAITLLRALQRESQRMLTAHSLGGSRQNVGMQLRPPVFAKAWPGFQARLGRWSGPSLTRLLARIYDCEHAIKHAGPTGEAQLRQLVNDLGRALATRPAR